MAGRGHSHPKGLLAEVLRRARARPGVLAVAALLLIGAGFAGGWMSSARLGAPKVDYTSAPIHPLRPRPAPPAPAALQAELDQLAEAYGEPVGIAVTDVAQGWTAAVQGDQDFPQQSVSKLWVAMTVLDAVDHRRLALDQWVVMRPEDRSVFYQPVAQHITGPEGFAIQLSDLLRRAISESSEVLPLRRATNQATPSANTTSKTAPIIGAEPSIP